MFRLILILALTCHVRYFVSAMRCLIHNVELICYCPACRGSITSARKVKASRSNGKLGGRPKGSKNKPKSKVKAARKTARKAAAKRGGR